MHRPLVSRSRFALLSLSLSLSLGCAHNPTAGARTCQVLNTETQLAACVGKTVTIRGRVTGTKIVGVDVDAAPELSGQVAHAIGTLERTGEQYVLKNGGALAKAHPTK